VSRQASGLDSTTHLDCAKSTEEEEEDDDDGTQAHLWSSATRLSIAAYLYLARLSAACRYELEGGNHLLMVN
jgi:hypothetical protein